MTTKPLGRILKLDISLALLLAFVSWSCFDQVPFPEGDRRISHVLTSAALVCVGAEVLSWRTICVEVFRAVDAMIKYATLGKLCLSCAWFAFVSWSLCGWCAFSVRRGGQLARSVFTTPRTRSLQLGTCVEQALAFVS